MAQFFEDDGDDNISIISEDSSVSDSVSCRSGESETLRRSARNTPTRNSLANKQTDKPIFNRKQDNNSEGDEEIYRVKRSEIGDNSLKVNINVRRLFRTGKNGEELETLETKTPERKRTANLDSDRELNVSVKKCRTEPRRKSLTVLQQETTIRSSPISDRKVRRAQSVLVKKVGNQYQSFRNPTPDSEGRKTRTRLSEKFEICKKTEEIKRSGREAFTMITNKPLSVSKKSPKPRSARQK